MQKTYRAQRKLEIEVISALENIYISPLESCNLHCRHCYTRKTKNILNNKQILSFIDKYSRFIHKSYFINLKSILFCGGEVFILKNFTKLINILLKKHIFLTIITNGTIDQLDQIHDPKNCQLIVSFDGPQNIHDANRGTGNFDKSVNFVQHARALGFPVEIFYLVTQDSYPFINSFNLFNLKITYLTDRLGSLGSEQVMEIKHHYPTYPAKNFGCFQLALQSDGHLYGCCESNIPLASISDPVAKIIKNFTQSISPCFKCHIHKSYIINHKSMSCAGCCQPTFLCNYVSELKQPTCQSVVNLL